MRFIIFVVDGAGNPANPNEIQNIDAFNAKLQANGNWIMAAGIKEPESAILIDNRKQANQVRVGSLFDFPEHYSGFWIISAATEDDAKQLAMEGSFACNRKVELRPFIQ